MHDGMHGKEVKREEFLGNFDCEKSTGMNGKNLSKVLVRDLLYSSQNWVGDSLHQWVVGNLVGKQ